MNNGCMLETQNGYYFILDESGKVVDAKLFNLLDVEERIKQLKEQYPTSKFVAYEIYEFFYYKYI
jgi:hypothetical protein